jgi:glycosyltransferase involved in cell wall biosynthesis
VIGGVERVVWELAAGFSARGIDVEVITSDPASREPTMTVENHVPVHRFPTLLGDSTFSVSPTLGLWMLRNGRRFALLHAHSYHTPVALEAFVAARRVNVPFVITPHYHGGGHSPLRKALHVPYRPIGRAMIRSAQRVVCVSGAERDLVRGDFGGDLEIALAPNGVDVDDILHAEPLERHGEEKVVLVAGRLERYKQVDRVVRAFALLPPRYQLVLIGDGKVRKEIERLIGDLNLRDRASVLGNVPRSLVHAWLRTADVFLSLSSREAFGIVVLEAAVGGAHVLASDIPAHREVGRYVPRTWVSYVASDASPDEIANLIASAERHDVHPGELSAVPRWSDTVEQTLSAYESAGHAAGPTFRP